MATEAAGPGRSDLGATRVRGTSTDETKAAFKTTEFVAYIAVVVAVLIAGLVVGSGDAEGGDFNATTVWLYVTILTFGYMLSRGIAKSGSRHRHTDDDH